MFGDIINEVRVSQRFLDFLLKRRGKREDRGESCVELWIEKFSGDIVMLSSNSSYFLICS